jgi:Zn-dependent protease with chaperone function
MQTSVATLASAVMVMVTERSGDWLLVRFTDPRWGQRAGYAHCSQLRALTIAAVEGAPNIESRQTVRPGARSNATGPNKPARSSGVPSSSPTEVTAGRSETIEGYAEWVRNDHLIVDGQRLTWNGRTRSRLGRLSSVVAIPLGFEVKAEGVRTTDGALLARQIEAKPNGIASYENEVLRASGALEETWLSNGAMSLAENRRSWKQVGHIVESGPDVERVRRVMYKLLPSYVSPSQLRLRVVDSGMWNAAAMANGAIWVHRGLLEDVSDDELAIVLGHELAHYTHEHTRRHARSDLWRQLPAASASAALNQMKSGVTRDSLFIAAELSLIRAWGNGYNRNLEDQADRVGLRYAYEGGFDVSRGPGMWARVLNRFGELDSVSNFFLGGHSRPSDRIRNLERELALNYGERLR